MHLAHPDAGLTRTEAVAALNGPFADDVTVHMVSMWALRGWVDPTTGERRKLRVVGVDRDGTRRYSHEDLVAADAATRLNTSRSHRRRAA